MPDEDAHARMAQLFVELLSSDGLPDLVCVGAYHALFVMTTTNAAGSAALCSLLLEMDISRLVMTGLQAIGSATEWVVSGGGMLMRWPRCVPSNWSCVYGVLRASAINWADQVQCYTS